MVLPQYLIQFRLKTKHRVFCLVTEVSFHPALEGLKRILSISGMLQRQMQKLKEHLDVLRRACPAEVFTAGLDLRAELHGLTGKKLLQIRARKRAIPGRTHNMSDIECVDLILQAMQGCSPTAHCADQDLIILEFRFFEIHLHPIRQNHPLGSEFGKFFRLNDCALNRFLLQ
ncbi:MAG: hypothetical protein BWY82_01831 [Verrucomicrobia bacterium ADurb.Bin474]|nr:MAG: hypothetical protein BWY82_01831 [Verrucomicrobia bacterium ADurb.Bin474]